MREDVHPGHNDLLRQQSDEAELQAIRQFVGDKLAGNDLDLYTRQVSYEFNTYITAQIERCSVAYQSGVKFDPERIEMYEYEANDLLNRGYSGTEIVYRLGSEKVAAEIVTDWSKQLFDHINGENNVRQSSQSIVSNFDDERFVVAGMMFDTLTERNQVYQQLTDDLLDNWLSYRDVLGENAMRAGSESEHPERAATYARHLARAMLGGKGEIVTETVGVVRTKFNELVALLPRVLQQQLSIYAESSSWILWDIGKQEALRSKRYASRYSDNLRAVNYSGSLLQNNDSNNENDASRTDFMRNVVAWRHFGWELHQMAMKGVDMSILGDDFTLLRSAGDIEHKGQLSSRDLVDVGRVSEALLRSAVE